MNFISNKNDLNISLVYDYFLFGEKAIPNAINPVYLNSVVETEYESFEISNKLFENNFCTPISMWDGELIIQSRIKERISTKKVIELVEKNKLELNKNIYFYILNLYGGASTCFGLDLNYNQNKSFFHFIPKKTLELIKTQDNFYLFLNYANEGELNLSWFSVIHNDALKFAVPYEKIIFTISDYNIHKNYENWCISNEIGKNQKIKTLYISWSLYFKSVELRQIAEGKKTTFLTYNNECSVATKESVNFNKIREKKFLLFNRRLRPHRVYSISYLNHLNLLNDFLISFDFNTMECFELNRDHILNYIKDENVIEAILENYKLLKNNKPKSVIDFENFPQIWGFNFEKKEVYLESYIHIISETLFFEIGGYFSEKTWKPIGNLQPFIFFGPANGLKELKKLGFKTFNSFIDESYDSEEDNEKRFMKIMNEIKRLSSIDKEEIHKWYNKIFEDVILYNQKLLFSAPENTKIQQKIDYDLRSVFDKNQSIKII